MPQPAGAVAQRERAALAARGIDPDALRAPRGVRMRGARRPLRVRPQDAALELEADAVRLRFALPPGSFASVLVEELFPGATAGAADDTGRHPGVC
jgi:tRNA(Glu) U13 pseudouridine synthase TruD